MKNLLIALTALALAACASQGTTTANDTPRKAEKEYRIGSNIPVRDGVGSSPTEVTSPSAMNPALPPK
ncbi:MAG: hypothetical protein U1F10_06685 [Burkholderiales bacterium]